MTGFAGDPFTAREQLLMLVPAVERVLGPSHPDTLGARRERARWAWLDGDPAAARDELSEVLPMMEAVLGAEHPRTVAARRDLASWTEKATE
jgi:hypothetical protein